MASRPPSSRSGFIRSYSSMKPYSSRNITRFLCATSPQRGWALPIAPHTPPSVKMVTNEHTHTRHNSLWARIPMGTCSSCRIWVSKFYPRLRLQPQHTLWSASLLSNSFLVHLTNAWDLERWQISYRSPQTDLYGHHQQATKYSNKMADAHIWVSLLLNIVPCLNSISSVTIYGFLKIVTICTVPHPTCSTRNENTSIPTAYRSEHTAMALYTISIQTYIQLTVLCARHNDQLHLWVWACCMQHKSTFLNRCHECDIWWIHMATHWVSYCRCIR